MAAKKKPAPTAPVPETKCPCCGFKTSKPLERCSVCGGPVCESCDPGKHCRCMACENEDEA